MAGEKKPEESVTTTNTDGSAGGAGGQPQVPPTADPGKPPAPASNAAAGGAAAGGAGEKPPEGEVAKPLPEDADEESLEKFADKDGNIKLPFKAFRSRIARAKKSELKAIFGTDDREAIVKLKSDYETMLTEREQKRRETLTENEKLKEDLERATKRAEEFEAREREREEAREIDEGDKEVKSIATKYVADDYVDDVMHMFARHLVRTYSDEELAKVGADVAEKWFKEYAEKKPAFAKGAPAGGGGEKPPEKKPEPARAPITNGPGGKGKPPTPKSGGEQNGAKTFRPGQPNSMSPAEVADEKRKRGLTW